MAAGRPKLFKSKFFWTNIFKLNPITRTQQSLLKTKEFFHHSYVISYRNCFEQHRFNLSRFLNYKFFRCIRIYISWYLPKLYRIFTSSLVESTTNSIAFVRYDVWTLSLLQTFINPKLLLQYA